MVIATDVNLKSALQYGVNNLGIKHIIVCGHYECGGVWASMNKADVGAPLTMWLSHLRDVYRTHQKELMYGHVITEMLMYDKTRLHGWLKKLIVMGLINEKAFPNEKEG